MGSPDAYGAFLNRQIEGDWPYLWIDATYVKTREAGRIGPTAAHYGRAVTTDYHDASNPDTSGFDPNGNAPHCWAGGRLQGDQRRYEVRVLKALIDGSNVLVLG